MIHIFIHMIRNNFRLLFIGAVIFLALPLIKKNMFNTTLSPEESNQSVEPGHDFTGHKTVKRELRADKYREDFQDFDSISDHHELGEGWEDFEKLSGKVEDGTSSNTIFTQEELAKYSGEDGSRGLYIAIMGQVYDVATGAKHYGPDGSYHFFAGRDASVSFITGEFETITEDIDNVLTLKPSEILSLKQWKDFYDKDYVRKGKLIGRFYTENGEETEYSKRVDAMIEVALDQKEREERFQDEYPPCNIEWKAETGTRVWCTDKSGGRERDWVGVPRKLFEAGKTDFRCACIRDNLLGSPNINEYENCDPHAISCTYNVD